jgi:hypothetical protein
MNQLSGNDDRSKLFQKNKNYLEIKPIQEDMTFKMLELIQNIQTWNQGDSF